MWQGTHIADIVLPPICATGGSGVPDLQSTGILTIANLARFTDFAAYLLLNPQFTWTISTSKLRYVSRPVFLVSGSYAPIRYSVKALGTIFDNVVLTKDVSFDGECLRKSCMTAWELTPKFAAFNKLEPGVTIASVRCSASTLVLFD